MLGSLPPIDSLTAALAAARTGSFSAAAAELGVTHAAISRRVAGAEQWAGFKIFIRHGRGVYPTPDGQRFLTRLTQLFSEIEGLVDRSHKPGAVGRVRLAVTPSLARLWLLPRLRALEMGDLRIEVRASQNNVDLSSGEADLAIRHGRGGWGLGPEQPLFSEALVPVGRLRPDVEVNDALYQLPLLHAADTSLWRACFKAHGLNFRNKSADRVLADYATTMDAAEQGLGLALWNESLHELPVGLGLLAEARFTPSVQYFVVAPTGGPNRAADLLLRRLLASASSKIKGMERRI